MFFCVLCGEKEYVLVFVSCACLAVVEACDKITLILFHISRTFKIIKLGFTIYKQNNEKWLSDAKHALPERSTISGSLWCPKAHFVVQHQANMVTASFRAAFLLRVSKRICLIINLEVQGGWIGALEACLVGHFQEQECCPCYSSMYLARLVKGKVF